MNKAANANLFSRLFDGLDDANRLAIETHDGQHISYGALIARAGQMANVLVARGVKPGDRVAAQTEKSVSGLVLYLATVRAGAVYLPLNTAYTLNELEYFITDAEPSLVVCDPSKAEGIGKLAAVYVVCLFGFIIWVGLVISWVFFSGIKPPLVTG